MSTKREWLEIIANDIESLVEWSETDPDAFNRLICKQELEKLKKMAAKVAAETPR
ncbi:MAG: hypothetical protein QNI91_13740 [Arenicellales bacterium]|nr:hypothetical protein [Arenicellales bacterium]